MVAMSRLFSKHVCEMSQYIVAFRFIDQRKEDSSHHTKSISGRASLAFFLPVFLFRKHGKTFPAPCQQGKRRRRLSRRRQGRLLRAICSVQRTKLDPCLRHCHKRKATSRGQESRYAIPSLSGSSKEEAGLAVVEAYHGA